MSERKRKLGPIACSEALIKLAETVTTDSVQSQVWATDIWRRSNDADTSGLAMVGIDMGALMVGSTDQRAWRRR